MLFYEELDQYMQLYHSVVHCNSIITRSSGSTGKTLRYNGPRYIHASVVQNL